MVLFLITVLCLALRQLFVWIRGMHHRRRLPPPAITSAQAAACQNQAFYEICRRSRGPGWRAVRMAEYFTDQGWNRADAMLILAEPLKHGLIKVYGWRFGMYGPTRTGWDEYRKNFMWSGGSEVVNISAGSGGFVVANVHSSHAVAQGGVGNSAKVRDVSHRQLIDALREDARSAEPDEAVRAQEYADDLAEAVQTENPARADRVLGRINALLVAARSAFALTRDLLPPGI
ncbi:hypothetical protein OIE49_19015 [Streptomyces sp. NBC_01788]|uniref:hypothetical protein n=1 Tax=Streptomyces sp. NBC_01788 TaxID=2975940 RepID=UPI002DDB0F20|nr:hypothetical protein [Streptomyces sp. NBC_01788]WSB31196.1 hypothetical protein OIE49_19015 [Streptomyces sp. NBC_01788]